MDSYKGSVVCEKRAQGTLKCGLGRLRVRYDDDSWKLVKRGHFSRPKWRFTAPRRQRVYKSRDIILEIFLARFEWYRNCSRAFNAHGVLFVRKYLWNFYSYKKNSSLVRKFWSGNYTRWFTKKTSEYILLPCSRKMFKYIPSYCDSATVVEVKSIFRARMLKLFPPSV